MRITYDVIIKLTEPGQPIPFSTSRLMIDAGNLPHARAIAHEIAACMMRGAAQTAVPRSEVRVYVDVRGELESATHVG